MIEKQEMIDIEISQLVATATKMKNEGYRLVQIGCSSLKNFEINYSFDKNYQFKNYKVSMASVETNIPSISMIYPNAFLYENEIHDLFGIKISGISVDYKGSFYRTSIKFPFNTPGPGVSQEGSNG